MMKTKLSFFFVLCVFIGFAQLTDGIPESYNFGDTLRGALRPERTCYDVRWYDLNLDIDFEEKYISGYNTIYFVAEENFNTLQIDLFENMQIDSIMYDHVPLKFDRNYNAVFVHFNQTIQKGTADYFTVYYQGKPTIAKNAPWDGGFSWKEDKNGNPWLGVSCEGVGASLWWPNKDHLSDEPDSMHVTCTYPSALMFVSNGQLVSDTKTDNRRTTEWKVTYPINNYNITLNIGDYANFTDTYTAEDGSKLLLDYWVLSYNVDKAKEQFEIVSPMMGCYEKYYGKYPFWNDNYKLVETPYLGMEHQSAIAYGNKYQKGYLGRDFSFIGLDFDYIIVHETGHEYWGNLVSCADIADMWIHESFTTYTEALYVECLYGYEKAQDYVNAKKRTVGNEAPIVGVYNVNVEGDGDMYNKGMLFLNTLRHLINNDDLWFSMLKDMTTNAFAYKTINAQDIIEYVNLKTGGEYNKIFEQYLYYKSIPKLYYNLESTGKKSYTIKYKWITDVTNFEMPAFLQLGDNEIRLDATNSLQSYDFTKKKKKDTIKINDEQFYIDVKEY